MKSYTTIPVFLMEYALVNQKISEVKLYIYLKLNCDGHINYSSSQISVWAKEVGVNPKTIKSSLQWLCKNKWITFNSKRGAVSIVSYKRIAIKLNQNIKTGVVFEPRDIKDYKYFKALCCAAVIVDYMKKCLYFKKRSARLKGVANTNRRMRGFCPFANSYLASCLGVSIATAYRYKREAEQAGFISTLPNDEVLTDNYGKVIHPSNYMTFKIGFSQEGINLGMLRKEKNCIKKIMPDWVRNEAICLRRKK